MNESSQLCPASLPRRLLRRKSAMSRCTLLRARLPVSSSSDQHSPRWPPIGRNGAAATPETWSPTKRACRSVSSPARSEATARASISARPRNVRWVAQLGTRELFQSGGRRRQGLHRHQRRRLGRSALPAQRRRPVAVPRRGHRQTLWQLVVPKLAKARSSTRLRRDEPGHLLHARPSKAIASTW